MSKADLNSRKSNSLHGGSARHFVIWLPTLCTRLVLLDVASTPQQKAVCGVVLRRTCAVGRRVAVRNSGCDGVLRHWTHRRAPAAAGGTAMSWTKVMLVHLQADRKTSVSSRVLPQLTTHHPSCTEARRWKKDKQAKVGNVTAKAGETRGCQGP